MLKKFVKTLFKEGNVDGQKINLQSQRTPEQKEYRKNLADTLREKRTLGPVGRSLAEQHLKKEQDNLEYWLNSRLNSSDAALKLMEAGKVYLVVRNLKKFERLNQKVAQKLIKAGYIETVLNSLERFEGLNHKMAFILTKAHGGLLNVLRGMKQFDERYHSDIALMLIKAGHEGTVLNELENFKKLNKKVAQKLMEPVYRYNFAREEFGENTAQERTKMRWGDVENIAKKIFLNLKHFNELYHAEIIQMIIDQRCGGIIMENLEKSEGLNQDIAKKLIEAGYSEQVEKMVRKNPEFFQ